MEYLSQDGKSCVEVRNHEPYVVRKSSEGGRRGDNVGKPVYVDARHEQSGGKRTASADSRLQGGRGVQGGSYGQLVCVAAVKLLCSG